MQYSILAEAFEKMESTRKRLELDTAPSRII